jgi:hypothetical protein
MVFSFSLPANYSRVYPDGRLEADGEGALEHEEHRGRRDACTLDRCGLELDLIDERSLHCHDSSHETDHGQ